LARIASDQTLSPQFTDNGLLAELVAPPDVNFDHANFYWRMELQGEFAATIHTQNTVGNESLEMNANRYRGLTVWVTRGRGAGQERTIAANTTTELTVASAWSVEPDATSFFVVAENSWRFGALSRTSSESGDNERTRKCEAWFVHGARLRFGREPVNCPISPQWASRPDR